MRRKKISKLISIVMFVLMVLFCLPVSAASVGSTASDPSLGQDAYQSAQTEYGETGIGGIGTDAYLTIDSSDVVVSVPTTIILSGSSDTSGNYIGSYSVLASGDISGDESLIVEPKNNTAILNQTGKDSVTASISQQQTLFLSDELSQDAETNGSVTATGLTAGSWTGDFTFLIRMTSRYDYYSSIELAVADANNLTTENADVKKDDIENAVAGLFISDGKAYLHLMKDETDVSSLSIKVPVEFDLNNKTLTFNDTMKSCIASSGPISLRNGQITADDSQVAIATNDSTVFKNVTINHINQSNSGTASAIRTYNNDLSIENCDVLTECHSGSSSCTVLSSQSSGLCSIVNSSFENNSTNMKTSTIAKASQVCFSTVDVLNSEFVCNTDGGDAYGFTTKSGCNSQITLTNTNCYATIDLDSSTANDVLSCGLYGADCTIDGGTYSVYGTKLLGQTQGEDAIGTSISVSDSTVVIKEDTAPVVVEGTNNGIAVFYDSNLTIYGGTFSSPNHGGLYDAGSSNSVVNIYGGKFLNTADSPEYENFPEIDIIGHFGGMYAYSNSGEINIQNAFIQGGTYGLRIKNKDDGDSCHVIISDSFVQGEKYAFSVSKGTLTLNQGVETQYSVDEFAHLDGDDGVINDLR